MIDKQVSNCQETVCKPGKSFTFHSLPEEETVGEAEGGRKRREELLEGNDFEVKRPWKLPSCSQMIAGMISAISSYIRFPPNIMTGSALSRNEICHFSGYGLLEASQNNRL